MSDKAPNPKNIGIYDYDKRISRTMILIKKELSQENIDIIERYYNSMITESLSKAVQHKHLQTILGLSRLLEKNWKDASKEDLERIISKVIQKHSPSGQETHTTHDCKKILKLFFRWLKLGSRHQDEVGDPPEIKHIKTKRVKDKISREDLLTESDKTRILYACGENARDRAFIDCLYDSGTRPGEILNLQLKHVKIDQHGIVLHVDGKTGARPVRLVNSIPNLSSWLNVHPFKDDPDAPLWINLNKAKYGQPMTYSSARQMVTRRCKMANMSKKVYLNLFRHSEATRTVKFMSETHMRLRHGWSGSSKMTERYVHLDNSDVDDVLFKHYGIKQEQQKETQSIPQACPVCGTVNNADANICYKCSKPLNLGGLSEIEESQKEEIKKLAKQLVSEEAEEWKEKYFEIQKEMISQRSSSILYNAMKGIPTTVDLKKLESQEPCRKPESLAWRPLLHNFVD